MDIKILGPGCPRCAEVGRRTAEALAALGVAADVEKVTDFKKIAEYRIYATPGLVINDKLKCTGRIPDLDEIKGWIREEM